MSSHMGTALSVQIFGESHGPFVGVTMDGIPAGLRLDMDALNAFVQRRAAKGSAIATGRKETDLPRIISGVKDGYTTGQPLTALFENADTHSADYGFLPDRPRPGHADYPATVKSGGFDDLRGSGHHSGRLTLPYVFAGAVARQLIATAGMQVYAHVLSIGHAEEGRLDPVKPDILGLEAARSRAVPTLEAAAGEQMQEAILKAKAAGDSLGGVVECVAVNVPAGLGDPFFDGVEALAAAHFFSIPAVKGVEFGAGFGAAAMQGSQYNDPYAMEETPAGHSVVTTRNSAGGLLGGITSGMPIVARVAFRPTPSISLEQSTVSLSQKTDERLAVHGRHDPCVVVRGVPVVESALALSLCELWLRRRGQAPFVEEESKGGHSQASAQDSAKRNEARSLTRTK